MIPEYIKKLVLLICSSLAGFLFSGAAVTGVIAALNYLAEDGPLFSPGLVSFFLVVPVMAILILLDTAALFYEWRTREDLGNELFGLGLAGGLGSAGLLHRVLIAPYTDELNILRLVIFLGLGALTSAAVFGTHWLGNLLWRRLDP